MNAILDNWRAGLGFPDFPVIDGHVHFDGGNCGEGIESIAAAVRNGIEVLDANGVDAACIVGGGGYHAGNDYIAGNDDLLAFCSAAPDRFVGFAHLNPNDREDNIRRELDRVWNMGFRCFKLINSYQQDYPSDGPNMMQIYRFAAERNMLVFNHYWPADVLERLAREFSSVNFITGHWYENAVLRLPNVFCNMWSLIPLGVLERGVREYGADTYLLGSDAFLNPISVGIGMIAYADLPDEDKRKMLGANMARLLAGVGALPAGLKAPA